MKKRSRKREELKECRQCLVLANRVLELERIHASLLTVNKEQLDRLVKMDLFVAHARGSGK